MANFQFSKSTFSASTQEDWNYESVGIFGQLKAMQGKKLQFTKKNLKGDNRIALQIFPKKYNDLSAAIKDDAVESLICTEPLSKIIRKSIAGGISQNKMLAYLLTLEIQQDIDDNDKYFLFQEKGDGEQLPSFLVDELKKEKVSFAEILESAAF